MARKKAAPRSGRKAKTPRPTRPKAVNKPAARAADAGVAIRKLDEALMKAASARNAAALVRAFYAPGAVLMPPGHPVVEGTAAIQGFFQGLLDSGFQSIKLETTAVDAAGDLAYSRGRYTLSLTPPGGAPVEDIGKYIVVYRRQPGGAWRAVGDIFNSDHAPAP